MAWASNFYTEHIQKQPEFTSPYCVRATHFLEPVLRVAVEDILREADLLGFPLMVTETYRSQQRQEALYKARATQLKTVGSHHFGLGCDFAKLVDGVPTYKGDWTFLGKLANDRGLIWGGPGPGNLDIGDCDHIQRLTVADQPYVFQHQWYPDPSYRPWP